jgi:hypothetical protein
MRLPVRSEADAFFIAWGLALVIGVALLLGYLLAPLVGIVFFIAVALAALVWDVATEDPERRTSLMRDAEESPDAGARSRVLVIANEALAGSALREELLGLGEPKPELQVVAPVLPPRLHYIVSDIDRERAEARERLQATLAWAREHGFEAGGRVGDFNDPVAAIGDELRELGAEHVVVATHPPERENWVEQGILEHVRKELRLPVTHVVVDRERDTAELGA